MNRHDQTRETPPCEGQCPDDMAMAAYLDGRATPEESATLERHLALCPRCAEAVRELRDLLGRSDQDGLDPEFLRQVADRAKKLAKP